MTASFAMGGKVTPWKCFWNKCNQALNQCAVLKWKQVISPVYAFYVPWDIVTVIFIKEFMHHYTTVLVFSQWDVNSI